MRASIRRSRYAIAWGIGERPQPPRLQSRHAESQLGFITTLWQCEHARYIRLRA
jgi:hypothetical protein